MINSLKKQIINKNSKINSAKYMKLKDFDVNKSNFVDFSNRKGLRQEWRNSIYNYKDSFNKKLPSLVNTAYEIIKSYFYLYSNELEKAAGFRRLRVKSRRSKTNRIFVSKPVLKHTNSSISITLYVYNRQKIYIKNKLKQLDKLNQLIDSIKFKQSINNIGDLWRIKYYNTRLKNYKLYSKINLIKNKANTLLRKMKMQKTFLTKMFSWSDNNFKLYQSQVYVNFLKKALIKEQYKIYYKQLHQVNNSKFHDSYLLILMDLISKLFGKKIIFNIINLKSFYLNSDIFTSAIALVLRKRENSVTKVLNKAVEKVKYSSYNKLTDLPSFYDKPKQLFSDNILYLNAKHLSVKINNQSIKKDLVNNSLQDIFKEKSLYNSAYKKEKDVFLDLKHKIISGVSLQANGRLTRRLIAARSVYKHKNIGSIKNINSSYRALYAPVFIGSIGSNVQYSKAHYKNRNGSFGIKGWISSK